MHYKYYLRLIENTLIISNLEEFTWFITSSVDLRDDSESNYFAFPK